MSSKKCERCEDDTRLLFRQSDGMVCIRCLGYGEPTIGENMSRERQLERWVRGESVHNSRTNECCPDFSCCGDWELWSYEDRIKFSEAYVNEDFDTVDKMMLAGLCEMMKRVYNVADQNRLEWL